MTYKASKIDLSVSSISLHFHFFKYYNAAIYVLTNGSSLYCLRRFIDILIWAISMTRGPHRYRRTVRVPILRLKIPVKKRIISSRYFGTGTMTKPPRC